MFLSFIHSSIYSPYSFIHYLSINLLIWQLSYHFSFGVIFRLSSDFLHPFLSLHFRFVRIFSAQRSSSDQSWWGGRGRRRLRVKHGTRAWQMLRRLWRWTVRVCRSWGTSRCWRLRNYFMDEVEVMKRFCVWVGEASMTCIIWRRDVEQIVGRR